MKSFLISQASIIRTLLLKTPEDAWWTSLLLWIVRITTFSLLLRTYLMPWLLTTLSKHMRIRSISLRSIRGLYVRAGTRIYRVDRVSYAWSRAKGLNIRFDGLNVEIGKPESKPQATLISRHNRKLTLADFSPTPIAYRIMSYSYSVVEPHLRPLIRTTAVACLRLFIWWLPHIISGVNFDLFSTSLTFPHLPGTQISVEKVSLHTNLSFTQLEKVIDVVGQDKMPRSFRARRRYNMAAWRRRFTDSFQRTLDRAWGKALGTAAVTLNLHNVVGATQPSLLSSGKAVNFLHLPGAIDLEASLGFNPREATIDAHSLKINLDVGNCFIKLDALNVLLKSLKKSQPQVPVIRVPERAASAPTWSFFSPTSSAANSEPFFSPGSSVMSPQTESPPLSAILSPDFMSPISPTSPFLEVLTASIRPRRRFLHQPCPRLKDYQDKSVLSVLGSANVKISNITFSAEPKWGAGPYEATIQDVTFNSSPCDDPSQNPLYQQLLGSKGKIDNHDSDSYGLKLSIQQVTVDRRTRLHSLRLVTVGTVDFYALAKQWPAPWLKVPPFMSGDPNAPLLAVRATMEGLELTERVECLRQLVAHVEPSPKPPLAKPKTPSTTIKLPRFSFEMQCGIIRGRIICADNSGSLEPLAVELRTNGFIISANSSFSSDLRSRQTSGLDTASEALRMDCKISTVFEPALVRVRSKPTADRRKFTALRSSDPDFMEDPSIFSMESLEVFGEGHAAAFIPHDSEGVASVLLTTPVLELHISTETICIELWHPTVMTSIHQLLSVMPTKEKTSSPSSPSSHPPLLDRLPVGLSATVALGRFVILVTAPDINPLDTLDLSRGFAFRTGLSVHYSSMHAGHAHRFYDLSHRTQTRHKLYLPQEQVVDAVSAARASAITHNASAHIRVSFTDLALRSAVATQYDADNPFIFERDDDALNDQEFLRIPRIRINLCLTGKRGPVPSKNGDVCDISVVLPEIRATFQLGYVYSMLLALQGAKSLIPPSLPRQPTTSSPSPSAQLILRFVTTITTVQILCVLPSQRLVLRVDGIDLHVSREKPLVVRLNKIVGWVRLPSQANKWDEDNGQKWEELLSFQSLSVSFPSSSGKMSIALDGDSARLRIPFGYVLADLITDASVTAKAIKHLICIAADKKYTDMPTPEAEGPKIVPHIIVNIRHLCLEASDDSLESKLAVIWRCGLEAVKQRIEREEAFAAKVAAIYQAESEVPPGPPGQDQDYQFGADHSVSIDEARQRLNEVHGLDWTLRLQNLRQKHSKSEDAINQYLRSKHSVKAATLIPNIVVVTPIEQIPPLFRVMLSGVVLTAKPPSFPLESLSDFLYEQGSGLPRNTQFSLLVPMHLNLTLTSLHITLRDYPLPLFSIPPHTSSKNAVFEFDTDLAIAEEMGTDLSVDWIECLILGQHHGARGAPSLSIAIPKTIMPVKSYANPIINITTNAATILSWAVSYTPAIQDLMKVIETLSSAPRDPSPGVGFWDKMRLLFHWSLVASFKGEVRFHMKGLRDPYNLADDGAGFVLAWQGNTKLLVGRKNEDKELIQVISDSMLIAIPNLEHLYPRNQTAMDARRIPETSKPFRKICARLRSGVRFGIGFVLERACGVECLKCFGPAFHRKCRHFDFRPHYEVMLEKKVEVPMIKGPDDSFDRFRSDFIHLSISLASSTRHVVPGTVHEPSSVHLTPKAFAHFWSWCALFDGALSLPTRQGSYYPPRIISPKLGRHLATLKYRVHLRHLFIMHAYIDESRETWADGVVPWIGVKAMIDDFHADMHQRDEESIVPGLLPDTTQVLRRKPVYAAELALKGLDLRALLATFNEPLRQAVEMTAPPQRSNYRAHKNLPSTSPISTWYDADDFIETDWSPSVGPDLHLLPVVTCPHFTYFKRNSAALGSTTQTSKFGLEETHTCILGKEESVPQIQISLASSRVRELRRAIRSKKSMSDAGKTRASLERMIALLEDYIALLHETDKKTDETASESSKSYLMPAYSVSPDEWAEFENVYQIHCPKIYMDGAIRDIMMQYYYCSRARKGLEYHMATRAVKFIRDQAEAALGSDFDSDSEEDPEKTWSGASATAQMAASALKKMLKGGDPLKTSVEISKDTIPQPPEDFDPLSGWSEGVSLRKSHCCLLLKPQIVMRGESPKEALIVAAVQAKLQAFAVMDDSNADDPICGKVMSRSLTSVSGLQTFSPAGPTKSGDGCVPLEVLIDLKCESDQFDRLVPQTEATFHYDKFNRLRLRNNVTSVTRTSTEQSIISSDNHLQDQTDLVRVHIPRFTVSASDEHFQAISQIVTKLLLFSDAAHKTRLEKLETLLFTYDFTDLASAAKVVADLQDRLGDAIESQRMAENNHNRRLDGEEGQLELLKLKAHIFLLSEELNFLFDAIKLAQDRFDDHTDQKSALLLHASSSEISWKMLDDRRDLLSKLVVQDINFFWLSRQDSSTGNNLSVGNLQAFDGSRYATWAEILCKHDEPVNHPLLKRGLFLLASWTILAPVGGITIYESFELSLHPLRLQIDARVGRRIMEYLWPARRHRQEIEDKPSEATVTVPPKAPGRASLDTPRALHSFKTSPDTSKGELVPPLRKLGSSRSFTDLKASARDTLHLPGISKMPSSETLRQMAMSSEAKNKSDANKRAGDAAEMKTRASQKSFVLVRISSLNLLLSIVKEGSFECHDAKIRTRDLEYRNQTWSFEELVNQFIPSDMSWRGWVKMAFQQPLLPVLPVARELFSKTKWLASSTKAVAQIDAKGPPPKLSRVRALSTDDDSKLARVNSKFTRTKSKSPGRGWRKASRRKPEPLPTTITTLPLTDEPESFEAPVETERPTRSTGRSRMKSLFRRGSSKGGDSMGSSTTLRPS